MVLLGVLTGLRIGEILALTWTHVDFSAGEIKVEQADCSARPKPNAAAEPFRCHHRWLWH